jgi:hypothetical protein
VVPLSADYMNRRAAGAREVEFGRTIAAGAAGFRSSRLDPRYGPLPPGRYTLLVRFPHPKTGVMLVSNTIAFEVDTRR